MQIKPLIKFSFHFVFIQQDIFLEINISFDDEYLEYLSKWSNGLFMISIPWAFCALPSITFIGIML